MRYSIFASLMEILVRKAESADVKDILLLIKELALFEKAPEAVINTEEQLLEDGFGAHPEFQALVAVNSETKETVGMALFYNAYSTWKGKYLFLDDLVVSEKYRRNGVGEQLIQAFLKEAKKQEVHFVKWQVLHWNSPAIEFYKKLGVEFDEEWIDCKKLI